MDEELNKDNILEQEKSFEKEKKRKKLKKILIPTIIILAIAIFFIVLIIILKFQIGNYKEEFDGTIYAKYIIRKDNQRLRIINKPKKDKITISLYNNGRRVIDFREYESDIELLVNKSFGSDFELKYKGKFTDFTSLFSYNDGLEEINITEIDSSQVTSMKEMFCRCYNLKKVYMNGLVTSNVENIDDMFYRNEKLELLEANFDLTKITSSISAFHDCYKLPKIDIKFDLTKVTNASYMFNDCHSLKEIKLINNKAESVPIDIRHIFSGNYVLTKIDLTNFHRKIILAIDYAFHYCNSLTSIDLSKFETSNVISVAYLFSNCNNLKQIDLSYLDVSNSKHFTNAFANCTSLESIDLSTFNTNKAELMTGLFYGCSSLISVDLSKYIINVYSLSDLFRNCESLQNVTLSVQNVTNVAGMFKGCIALKYLDLSEFCARSIKWSNNFFPEEVNNATVIYNSHIFGQIKVLIPNKGIIFIDINLDLY